MHKVKPLASYLTSKTANPVKHFWIMNTKYKIVLSYSTRTDVDCMIDFLGIPLHVVRDAGVDARSPGILTTTGKTIPDSWFVDLMGDIDTPKDAELVEDY